MIYAMGSRCSDCGKVFHPDKLIVDHIKFDDGQRLGYNSPERHRLVDEFGRTGKLPDPEEVRLLCDRCNRKRHGYRPSRKEIFGDSHTALPEGLSSGWAKRVTIKKRLNSMGKLSVNVSESSEMSRMWN